jgi:hypothetical protein
VCREGETAELSCDTLGSPVPTVRWTRRDRDLSGLAHRAVIGAHSAGALSAGSTGGGGRLLLMNVTASYAGSYTCTASNGLKYPLASLDILLVVLCKSYCFLQSCGSGSGSGSAWIRIHFWSAGSGSRSAKVTPKSDEISSFDVLVLNFWPSKL